MAKNYIGSTGLKKIFNLIKGLVVYNKIGDITFTSQWSGTISCGYITPRIGMIWGGLERIVDSDIVWGEKVLSVSSFPAQKYFHVLNGFKTSGEVINAFCLVPAGEIRIYSPDYSKIENHKTYNVWGLFYINKS